MDQYMNDQPTPPPTWRDIPDLIRIAWWALTERFRR